MPLRIDLQGDKAKAAGLLGWAKGKLFMLKSQMKLLNIKQDSKTYLLEGFLIFIESIFGQDTIRIIGKGILDLFVAEYQELPAAMYAPRIQSFTRNIFKKLFDVTGVTPDWFTHDIAFSGGYIFAVTGTGGWMHKYSQDGRFVESVNLADVICAATGYGLRKPVYKISVSNDRIAVVCTANVTNWRHVYVFDMSYNYLYRVPAVPAWSTGAGGIDIYRNKLYISWSETGGYYGLTECNLETGAIENWFEDDAALGEYAENISVYGGKLYAADTEKNQIVTYRISDYKIDSKKVFAESFNPRGLAVCQQGILASSLLAPTPKVSFFDFNLNRILDVGSYSNTSKNDGEYYLPLGLAIREI